MLRDLAIPDRKPIFTFETWWVFTNATADKFAICKRRPAYPGVMRLYTVKSDLRDAIAWCLRGTSDAELGLRWRKYKWTREELIDMLCEKAESGDVALLPRLKNHHHVA
jgi:hypothetical protein